MTQFYRLAPMSASILAITLVLLVLPVALLVGAAVAGRGLLILPALFFVVIYLWVWLRFRPRYFAIDGHNLTLVWPLKYRRVPCSDITAARVVDRKALRAMVGWGMRVGAGGLWGGFGWLWTKRRGIVQMYVSRIDEFVWIERRNGRPLLITPEKTTDFVSTLTGRREVGPE